MDIVPTKEALIKLEAVNKQYASRAGVVRALSDVNLTVQQGEYVAITGTSGSGKSTLLGVIGLLEPFQTGKFQIAGRDVSQLTFSQRSKVRNKYIGLVFQAFNLISSRTVLENVLLPLRYSAQGITEDGLERAHHLLNRVGLKGKLNSYSTELSGGQQQRVAIARSMVTSPAIMLADEPTGNLDAHTSQEILELFESLNSDGVTLLMVTHDSNYAARAQRIVEIRDGVVTDG